MHSRRTANLACDRDKHASFSHAGRGDTLPGYVSPQNKTSHVIQDTSPHRRDGWTMRDRATSTVHAHAGRWRSHSTARSLTRRITNRRGATASTVLQTLSNEPLVTLLRSTVRTGSHFCWSLPCTPTGNGSWTSKTRSGGGEPSSETKCCTSCADRVRHVETNVGPSLAKPERRITKHHNIQMGSITPLNNENNYECKCISHSEQTNTIIYIPRVRP